MIFAVISLSYIIASAERNRLSNGMNYIFTLIGSYWMAALMYFFIFILLAAIGIGILKLFIHSKKFTHIDIYINIVILAFTVIILFIGTVNARNLKVSEYKVNIHKTAANNSSINAVMVSDVHLGTLIGNNRLENLVNEINGERPDIVFLCGDLINNDVNVFLNNNMGKILKRIKSKYGVYGVLGNHEYFGGDIEKVKYAYESSNIKLLMDDSTLINDSFYVVGRNDYSQKRISGKDRMSITSLLKNIDMNKPIILLDHQPVDINQVKLSGVDLQLSGHTHKGQFFPNNLITHKLYVDDYGYLNIKDFNLIVSSGYGTWGPPIRIGSNEEIVKIDIKILGK
jgi:predicted MPP superfamily phosphohydrolase